MSRLVTVFTDISLDPKTGAAAWAAWAKVEGVSHKYGAAFRTTEVKSTTILEAMGVVNGLAYLGAVEFLRPRDRVIHKTDNRAAIKLLTEIDAARCPQKLIVRETLQQVKEAYEFTLILRHVKGHQESTAAPRYAVNNAVDALARKLMQERRQELRAGVG